MPRMKHALVNQTEAATPSKGYSEVATYFLSPDELAEVRAKYPPRKDCAQQVQYKRR